MNAGWIGTGTMGSMLATTFVRAGALAPQQIYLLNRNPEKAQAIAVQYPGMSVCETLHQLVESCQIIFICVKPLQYPSVLQALSGLLSQEHLVISITSPISIGQLESLCSAKVAKLIPSVTNTMQAGVALYTFGERLGPAERRHLLELFAVLGKPVEIAEQYTRIASDLSSCGPAFIALLLEMWVQAAVGKTCIPVDLARAISGQMLDGLAKLLASGCFTNGDIIAKVSVPGGITAAGIECLGEQCNHAFRRLTEVTHAKFVEDCEKVSDQLAALHVNRRQC